MRDTKLYKTLVQLSATELNKLHRFVMSPYFNRNQGIISLFEWFKKDLKEGSDSLVSKEELWKICFGDEDFEDGRFRKIQSDLLKLVERYFAQESYEANPIHKARYLLDFINENSLESLESSAIKSAIQFSNEQDQRNALYYYMKYEVEQSIYLLSRNKTERSSKSNIENIVTNLDHFYLAEKLRYFTSVLTHQHFAAVNYKMLFIDEIIQHIKENDYSEVPAILIYYQILLTSQEPENRIHYDKLRELITKYIHYFPETQAKEILDSAFNYCILKSNAGDLYFVRELFNLYIESLDNKLILVKNQLTPWSFKNIVTAGLRLKEFNWVENFINQYCYFLEEKFRENAITFNYAQFYFYKKDFQKVIELLSKVEYEDFTYNLNSKTLLMASYFELDEFDALNSLLDSFRLYVLRNKKLTEGKGKHYKNTIAIVRKLTKIMPGDTTEIEKLKKEIETTQGVVSKNWILEKLENLSHQSN